MPPATKMILDGRRPVTHDVSRDVNITETAANQ
jgi:hypothetical protein